MLTTIANVGLVIVVVITIGLGPTRYSGEGRALMNNSNLVIMSITIRMIHIIQSNLKQKGHTRYSGEGRDLLHRNVDEHLLLLLFMILFKIVHDLLLLLMMMMMMMMITTTTVGAAPQC
jgi:hypothetical protein